jgi:hypothetical protein
MVGSGVAVVLRVVYPRIWLHRRWAGATLDGSRGAPPRLSGMRWSTLNDHGDHHGRLRSMGCPHTQHGAPEVLRRSLRRRYGRPVRPLERGVGMGAGLCLEGDEVLWSSGAAPGVEPVSGHTRSTLDKNVAGFAGEHVEAGGAAAGCACEPDAACWVSRWIQLHRRSPAPSPRNLPG